MASATLIPVSEYLETSYRPDCDSIDGEVRERNVGLRPHVETMGYLGYALREFGPSTGTYPLLTVRVQVSEHRIFVPDVCLARRTPALEQVIRIPPLLCVEVIAPEDCFSDLQSRVDDYLAMGVETVWVVDPWRRRGYFATTKGFEQPGDGVLTVSGSPIRIALADVFAELDETQRPR